MKQRTRWLSLGVVAALLLAAAGASAPYAQPIGPAVGEFVTMLVNQGPGGGSLSAEDALRLMRQRGLGLVVADPNAPLTEASLARILKAYGFQSTTQNPGGIVDFGLATGALSLLSTSVLYSGVASPGGISAPITPPQDCLYESNPGQCASCCVRRHFWGPSCARLCSSLVPSPSVP